MPSAGGPLIAILVSLSLYPYLYPYPCPHRCPCPGPCVWVSVCRSCVPDCEDVIISTWGKCEVEVNSSVTVHLDSFTWAHKWEAFDRFRLGFFPFFITTSGCSINSEELRGQLYVCMVCVCVCVILCMCIALLELLWIMCANLAWDVWIVGLSLWLH